jgi:capsule polysaccharide modification protein KpsS
MAGSSGVAETVLQGRRLLLLQGPAGPFFARVAEQLRRAGAEISKVNFNGGEDLYFRGPGVVRYRGSLADWPNFFQRLLDESSINGVILFGDCRPLHRAAIERAEQRGVEVFVFEEGYVRPDFVTLERDGVNGHSRISRDPRNYDGQELSDPPHLPVEHAFLKSALHTICYAAAVAALRSRYPEYQHHRDIRPLAQAGLWLRGSARRAWHTLRDRAIAARIEAKQMPPYFFVPLQVHLDSQLSHSRFTSITEFIHDVIASFAAHAPPDHALVLKLHPMDRAYSDYSKDIANLSRTHHLEGRLFYVDVINLPAALRGARGTVVINSTVGLSSLVHGTPVKCLGRAVYDMPGLTHQGALSDFFRDPGAVDRALYRRFRHWLLVNNQLNGSVWSRLFESPAPLIATARRLEEPP